MQSQVDFNRVPGNVPEKVREAFSVAEPGQIQQGSGGSGKGQALVQSQVKFNRVSEKVLVKVPGGFGAEPSQV